MVVLAVVCSRARVFFPALGRKSVTLANSLNFLLLSFLLFCVCVKFVVEILKTSCFSSFKKKKRGLVEEALDDIFHHVARRSN